MTLRIAPSILSADLAFLSRDVERVLQGGADQVHVDVMDGHFVPNLTFGAPVVSWLRRHTPATLDCHLMVEHPENYIAPFRDAGASILTIHAEATKHLERHITAIREAGMRPGVAINPATPISAIEEVVHEVELILIMTVNPGFGGQQFWEPGIDKVRKTRALLDKVGGTALLEVDGGVSRTTIGRLAAAGADTFVAGHAIYSTEDPGAEVGALRKAATDALMRRA